MKIYLIRHGKTPGNELRQYIGTTDASLSENGKAELEQIKNESVYPEAAHVYVSPMKRCRETAAVLFPGAKKTVVNGLREMDFGIFEQRSADDMKDDEEYRRWVDSGCTDPIPKGEVRSDFIGRCEKAFLEAIKSAEDKGMEEVFFIIHGGTIMSIMYSFAKPEGLYYDWYVKNGRCIVCDWDGRNLRLLS